MTTEDRLPPLKQKPTVSGPIDGNIYYVLGAARGALRHGEDIDLPRTERINYIEEMSARVQAAPSYDHALVIIQEYVNLNP